MATASRAKAKAGTVLPPKATRAADRLPHFIRVDKEQSQPRKY